MTPGVISIRFIPAVWDATKRYYTNYIGYNANPALNANPSRDNTGTFQDLEVGHYKYTFASRLPATLDATKPHTLAVMGSRNTTDIIGKQYYAVPQYVDFVPSTGATADDVERDDGREVQPVPRPDRAARRQLPRHQDLRRSATTRTT